MSMAAPVPRPVVCVSDSGKSRVKVKAEGSYGVKKKKVGYAAPVFAEPPSLFPFTLARGYTRKEFAEKYGLHYSGMSPKHLRESDVTEEELVRFFGPTVNKNGHRYMFLGDEGLIQRIESMWMICHQKSVVLQSRLITKAMAKGFYMQEVKGKKPNWALYVEWTNNEQLRRRQKLKSKAESNGEDCPWSDEEDDGEFEEGGSTQSKLTVQEAGSRHGGVFRDQQGMEVFTTPGGLNETIACWKAYFTIAQDRLTEAKKFLDDAQGGRDEYMQSELKARSQVEFCESKLAATREKCMELVASQDTLQRVIDDGRAAGEDLASRNDDIAAMNRKIQSQKGLVEAFEDCLEEANVELVKVMRNEEAVCMLVSTAELDLMQADRHDRAVKLLIGRLEGGNYIFRSVSPRPYAALITTDPPMQVTLSKCVACGLGFAPVWTVKLASCCHPYHEWCSRLHFETSTTCIALNCGAEMHEGWWACTGLLMPRVGAPLRIKAEVKDERQSPMQDLPLPVVAGTNLYMFGMVD